MTPRDRRVLLIGAAVVFGAVLCLRIVPAAVHRFMEDRSRLAAERNLLGATELAVAQRAALEDSVVALTAAVAGVGSRLLSGASAAAALNDLSGRLTRSPRLQRARMVGLTLVPDSSRAGSLRRLCAEIHVQTDFRGLADVLGALIQDQATLEIERMRVTGAEQTMPEPMMEQLEVEVLVTGWYDPGGREHDRTVAGEGVNAEAIDGKSSLNASGRHPVESVDALLRLARIGSPFRISRRPPTLRFGEALPPAPPPSAPKPMLLLTGILWGSEPAAILEGIPGQESAVVLRRGESVGAVRVVRLERQRVLLSGFDTTWTLSVRQPWQ